MLVFHVLREIPRRCLRAQGQRSCQLAHSLKSQKHPWIVTQVQSKNTCN